MAEAVVARAVGGVPAAVSRSAPAPARTESPPGPDGPPRFGAEALPVRTVNADGDRLFPQEAGPEGCASGECLPEVADAPELEDEAPEPPTQVAQLARPPASPSEAWRAAVDKVRAASPRHGASLAFGRLISLRPGEVTLAYPREAGFHRTTIGASTGKTLVEKVLAEHFGRPTRMLLEEGTDAAARAAPSIAEQDLKHRADHEKSTDAKVRTHPAMRAVLKLLGGEIEHIQVLERERPPTSELEPPEDGG
ncbi:MAG: DNA polymerase III subunit gamma/tau [Myxococcota bacterium]|nr:DNA polymerase III subunit gamma/tau [Myxococcota bacterium]